MAIKSSWCESLRLVVAVPVVAFAAAIALDVVVIAAAILALLLIVTVGK